MSLMGRILRSGYTTGACAAAAALGAARMLSEQRSLDEVTLELPAGEIATFVLHGQTFNAETAHCFVIKDAGDDPDITNGVEVHAEFGQQHRYRLAAGQTRLNGIV